LLRVHFLAYVLHDGGGVGGVREDVEGVVEDGGEEARGVSETDHGDFVGSESLDDVVD
jgi:hypothetical protein